MYVVILVEVKKNRSKCDKIMKYLYFDGQTTRTIFYFIIHSTFRRWQPYNSSVWWWWWQRVLSFAKRRTEFAAIPFKLFRWADRTSTGRTKNDLLADCIFLLFLYSLYIYIFNTRKFHVGRPIFTCLSNVIYIPWLNRGEKIARCCWPIGTNASRTCWTK